MCRAPMLNEWLSSLDAGSLATVAVVLFGFAAIGLGSIVAGFARIEFASPAFRLFVCAAIGVDALALLVLLAGLAGVVGPVSVWSALGTFAALGVWRERDSIVGSSLAVLRGDPLWVGLFVALAIFYVGSTDLLPGGWDSLTYQVAVPYRWMEIGRPDVLFDLPYSAFPALPQLLLWPLVTIGGITAPRLLQWLAYMFVFAGLHAILRRQVPKLPAMSLTLAFALAPVCLVMVKDMYAEPWILVQIIGALALLVGRRDGSERRGPVMGLLGLFAGAACAVKLTGLSTAAVLLMLGALHAGGASLAGLARFAIVASVFAVPFYLRAWVQTGNPLYPFFASWFTSDEATLEMSRLHHKMGDRYGFHGWSAFFKVPILAAYHKVSAFDRVIVGWQFVAAIALAVVAAIPRFRGPHGRLALHCAIGAALMYVFWFFTAQQTRFLLPLSLILTVAAGGGLAGLANVHARVPPIVAGALLVLTAVIAVNDSSFVHYRAAWTDAWRKQPSRPVAAMAGQGYTKAVRALLKETPPDARVLLMFERRGLYIPRRHEIGTPFFQAARFTPPPKTADELLAQIVADGFDYVLLSPGDKNPDAVPGYGKRQKPVIRQLQTLTERGALEQVWAGDGYRLLRVTE